VATEPPPPATGDKAGAISNNHGHQATILAAQLQAGGSLTLDIRGVADHSHSVALSADEMILVRGGTRVSKVSSAEREHQHTVTFN
jgi:hypothetical protein